MGCSMYDVPVPIALPVPMLCGLPPGSDCCCFIFGQLYVLLGMFAGVGWIVVFTRGLLCEHAIAHLEEERTMPPLEPDGVTYNDDRMFILYICKCTIEENADSIRTIIHYQETPLNCIWSVATFRNNPRYTLCKIDHFNNKEEAEAFVAHVEPQTPLVSLGGQSPTSPLSFSEYSDWKSEMNLKEYDYKSMFLEDSVNPTDTLTRMKR